MLHYKPREPNTLNEIRVEYPASRRPREHFVFMRAKRTRHFIEVCDEVSTYRVACPLERSLKHDVCLCDWGVLDGGKRGSWMVRIFFCWLFLTAGYYLCNRDGVCTIYNLSNNRLHRCDLMVLCSNIIWELPTGQEVECVEIKYVCENVLKI